MASSIQSYKPTEQNPQGDHNSRDLLGFMQFLTNKYHVPNKGKPVASQSQFNGSQVPNMGKPVANQMQNGSHVPNMGKPVASQTQMNGWQVPNTGKPVASHTQIIGTQVPNKGKPVANHTQLNGSQVPNKGQNYETSDIETSDDESDDETPNKMVPNKGGTAVASHTQKPELNPYHVASFHYAHNGKPVASQTQSNGSQAPNKGQPVNYETSDIETSDDDDDNDDKTYAIKGPVASQTQKPGINANRYDSDETESDSDDETTTAKKF